MDGKDEISFMIKPLGKWTANLRDQLFKSSQVHDIGGTPPRCPFSFKAGVEGPYGDESNFYLKYKVLVLIGGGIGVTPLLAILSDVLHRKRLGQGEGPSSIHVYHCVRTHKELCILHSIDPNGIFPEYQKHGIKIHVCTYVTSESKDREFSCKNSSQKSELELSTREILCSPRLLPSDRRPDGVSSISSKGATIWVACTIGASIIGYYILWGLSNVYIIKNSESEFPNYNRAHLVLASMIMGTTVFGGIIVLAWNWQLKQQQDQLKHSSPLPSISSIDSEKTSNNSFLSTTSGSTSTPHSSIGLLPLFTNAVSKDPFEDPKSKVTTSPLATSNPEAVVIALDKVNIDQKGSDASAFEVHGTPWNEELQEGHRPNWNDIFVNLNKEYQGQNLGILVSGPPGMRQDIARQCQKHTRFFQQKGSSNVFHYHSISFDL